MTDDRYLAHSANSVQQNPELMVDHSFNVAFRTKLFSEHFGFDDLGQIGGLLHDIGKYQDSFQKRIRGKNIAVEHSICGAREALNLITCDKANPINAFNREILAYIIAGHHSGLPDCGTDADNESLPTLKARLTRMTEDYSAYKADLHSIFPADFYTQNWIAQLSSYGYNLEDKAFAMSLITRILYSALVDADSLETERFYTGKDRAYYFCTFECLEQKLLNKLSSYQNAKSGSINEKRNDIQKACFDKADSNKGIFSLTVPTGGGKTLSSMVFAINHLLKKGHRRIIYVIPYTAIIEQTANIFKEVFGEENVLEHHSNYTLEDDSDENSVQYAQTENWDAPIILTTNVQFFESMFSNKRGQCRKLHNIANSVIIFDEAQMLPVPYLKPCLKAVDIFTRNFNCTALLMSATCPDFKPYLCENAAITEINENYQQHYLDFKRISAEYINKKSDDEIKGLIDEKSQTLVVVNTRKHARELFFKLPTQWNKYHLSTLMTPKRRKEVLAKIKNDLAKNKPCVVVSTALIECGVDLDFAEVYRSLAGIDSIVQAGGRCNREGKRNNSKVYVFESEGDPTKGDIPIHKSIARTICEKPKGTDILSLDNINEYFTNILTFKDKETDSKDILSLFRIRTPAKNADPSGISYLKFDFTECSKRFRYIDDADKYDIIISIDDTASSLIQEIRDGAWAQSAFRKLGQYTVSVYKWEFETLKKANKIETLKEDERQSVLICNGDYDDNVGLMINEDANDAILVC